MCTFRDLEGGASKTSVPFDIHRQRSERQTEPSENHACSLQSFLWDSWSGIAFSDSANDHRESGTCCSQTVLKNSMGKIWWSLSVNLRCKRQPVFFFFRLFSKFLFLSLFSHFSFFSPCSPILFLALTFPCVDPNTPPCVDSPVHPGTF